MRLTKTVDGKLHTYLYEGGLLVQETRGDEIFDYSYDANGSIRMLKHRATESATPTYYYYALNSRNDVVGLYNSSGAVCAKYTYDPWGNIISITDGEGNDISNTTGISVTQPFRYRSYYYDTDSGFYYLQSRYYDPVTHRFVNADTVYVSTGTGVLGFNMFAYCDNNPINFGDHSGNACVCLTKRVRSGHVCNDPDKKYIIPSSGVVGTRTKVSNYSKTQSVDLVIAGAESGIVSGKNLIDTSNKPVSLYLESDVKWWNFEELRLGIQLNLDSGRGIALSKSSRDIALSIIKDGETHSFSYGTDMISYTVEGSIENIDGIYTGSYSKFYYRPNVIAMCLVAVLVPCSATVVVPALA